jgi:hypothetical protein
VSKHRKRVLTAQQDSCVLSLIILAFQFLTTNTVPEPLALLTTSASLKTLLTLWTFTNASTERVYLCPTDRPVTKASATSSPHSAILFANLLFLLDKRATTHTNARTEHAFPPVCRMSKARVATDSVWPRDSPAARMSNVPKDYFVVTKPRQMFGENAHGQSTPLQRTTNRAHPTQIAQLPITKLACASRASLQTLFVW